MGDADFLSQKKGMITKIKEMRVHIANLSLTKLEVDLSAQTIGSGCRKEVRLVCERYLQPYMLVDPLQCTSSMSTSNTLVGDTVMASILLKDSNSVACSLQQCVLVELYSSRFGYKVAANVEVLSPSQYRAHNYYSHC